MPGPGGSRELEQLEGGEPSDNPVDGGRKVVLTRGQESKKIMKKESQYIGTLLRSLPDVKLASRSDVLQIIFSYNNGNMCSSHSRCPARRGQVQAAQH